MKRTVAVFLALILLINVGVSAAPSRSLDSVGSSPTLTERDAYFLTLIDGKEPATDSASAATAMATGEKTDAGNIAWETGDPVNGEMTTIAEKLRSEQGFAIGVASTVPFDHATPASFVSHNVNRNNYAELGHEMVFTTTPEVIIGGGNPEFYKGGGDYRYLAEADYNALVGGLTAYTHVVTRETGVDGGTKLLSAASTISLTQGHKLFGYFGGEGGQFDYHEAGDMPGSPSVTRGSVEDPTLAQIVDVTLDVLNQDEDGFFVMFEQGNIDWSNHANNFENMIGGVWDLEQAVAAAEDFVDTAEGVDWNNTLVVVTSDHSNSYLRLHSWLGAGDLPRQFGADYAWDYPDGEVSYQTTNHTSELVTLWARGQGAELFEQYAGEWYTDTMIVDNTRIYNVMLDAVEDEGVEHVILFVGDGMNIEHEIAGSRYLYDIDMGLTWHDWYQLGNGWAGFVSTWDVDTYEKYEGVGAMAWDPDNFDPTLGYDPAQGGWVPYPLQWTQGEVRMPIVYLPLTHGAPPVGR